MPPMRQSWHIINTAAAPSSATADSDSAVVSGPERVEVSEAD